LSPIEYIGSENARKEIWQLLLKYKCTTQLKDLNSFKVPKTLYRYSKISQHLIDNLIKNTLTATSPTEFNDLYDSTMHFDTVSLDKKRFEELNESSKRLGFEEVISKETEEILLKEAKEIDEFSLTYLSKNFRIVCLSSYSDDIKMWSHYSDRNNGVCIAYDFSKSKNNLDRYIYPVSYMKKPIDVTELCEIDKQILQAALVSIISKFEDWEHEKEWRLIFYFDDDQKKRLEISTAPKPEFILLGNRFIDNIERARFSNRPEFLLIEKFIILVKEAEIDLKIVKPQIRSFQLKYEDIDVNEIVREIR
jgi:hypothetical protein